MYFDRFDICEAYYVYATLYHAGQFSSEYEIFGRLDRIGFDARPSLSDRAGLTENGQSIFDMLTERGGE